MPKQVSKSQLERMVARGATVKSSKRKPLPDDASLDQRLGRLFEDQTKQLNEISQRIEKASATTAEVETLRKEMVALAAASKVNIEELVAGIKSAIADLAPKPDTHGQKMLAQIANHTRESSKPKAYIHEVVYDDQGDVKQVVSRPAKVKVN
jgi:hypothetical protein